MTTKDKLLCALYALFAAVALPATWINNLAFMTKPDSGGVIGFLRAAYANAAAASFANDLLLVAVVACIFMVVEARRLRIRYVWLYIVLSTLVAISVTFPLFLIARQVKMAKERD
jgi:hypothetical protein